MLLILFLYIQGLDFSKQQHVLKTRQLQNIQNPLKKQKKENDLKFGVELMHKNLNDDTLRQIFLERFFEYVTFPNVDVFV